MLSDIIPATHISRLEAFTWKLFLNKSALPPPLRLGLEMLDLI